MKFQSLVDNQQVLGLDAFVRGNRPADSSLGQRGCDACELNGKANKIINIDKLAGRSIFVWAQSPGKRENEKWRELVGPAGKLLWGDFAHFGVHRSDCDIQNVLRCRPMNEEGHDRTPTEHELHCCSIWTERALKRARANVHLVLGEIAGRKLLGSEYRRDRKAFWSDRFNAFVVCTYHPSYFLRGGTKERRREFRNALRAVSVLQHVQGQYGILKHFDYGELKTARALHKFLLQAKATGARVASDVEDDVIDNQLALLCIGFCYKPGLARTVFLDHPQRRHSTSEYDAIMRVLAEYFRSRGIEKVFHHGSHDVPKLQEKGLLVKGYRFDTEYSTYLHNPALRKYGLANLVNNVVLEFAGYKSLPMRHARMRTLPNGKKVPSFSTVHPAILGRYNCADCDVTKRLELRSKDVPLPLLRVFIACGFVMDGMESNGPEFDYRFYKRMERGLPKLIHETRQKLRRIAGNPAFNPGSNKAVAHLLYRKLELEPPLDQKTGRPTKSTGKKMLEQLKTQHPAPGLVIQYRELDKLKGTYVQAYRNSADRNNGRVRTKWWLTGTITGRLRSGGGDDEADGIVNLQNIANDPEAQNLMVADPRWYDIADALAHGWDAERILHDDHLRSIRTFLAFDYKGIEVRELAEIARDPTLIKIFRKGRKADPHSEVGHVLTGKSVEEIIKEKKTRVMIKGFHFALIYGKSASNLLEDMKGQGITGYTLADVEKFYDDYFERFSRVRDYINEQRHLAENLGYVESLFGFRRPVYANETDDERGTYWGNQAINSPIQGTAHQLLLMAMASRFIKKRTYHLLQDQALEVHDSVVFRVRLHDLPAAYNQGLHLLERMVPAYVKKEFGFSLQVPLVAEAEAGFRLGVMVNDEVCEQLKPTNFLPMWMNKNSETEKELREKYGEDTNES